MELVAYAAGERTPFVSWYENLDDHAAFRVAQALDKMRRESRQGSRALGAESSSAAWISDPGTVSTLAATETAC